MHHTHWSHPDTLELYAFYWSEARLLIAALALFLGGYPPIMYFNPFTFLFGFLSNILTLAWVISGVVSGYLAYRWYTGNQKVFGKKETTDLAAFGVMVVTGLNLGFAGLFTTNIGMSIVSSKFIFFVAGIVYVGVAAYMWKRWNEHGKKLFA